MLFLRNIDTIVVVGVVELWGGFLAGAASSRFWAAALVGCHYEASARRRRYSAGLVIMMRAPPDRTLLIAPAPIRLYAVARLRPVSDAHSLTRQPALVGLLVVGSGSRFRFLIKIATLIH